MQFMSPLCLAVSYYGYHKIEIIGSYLEIIACILQVWLLGCGLARCRLSLTKGTTTICTRASVSGGEVVINTAPQNSGATNLHTP